MRTTTKDASGTTFHCVGMAGYSEPGIWTLRGEKTECTAGSKWRRIKLAWRSPPDALKMLVDSDRMKVTIPHVKIRFRKFKDAFEASLQGFSLTGSQGFSLAGLEQLNEDVQDA